MRSSISPIPASASPSTPLCTRRIARWSLRRPRPRTSLENSVNRPRSNGLSTPGRSATRSAARSPKWAASTWYFISFDYALGKALQRDATEAIVKAGGSVLGSVSHPLGATDFGSYLLQAQASGAKVIALADTGADAINAIRQAAEFQVVGPDRRLAALFLQITDIDALGLERGAGAYPVRSVLLGSQ